MRYFLDTEFHDAVQLGTPLQLISIGLVREDAPTSGKRFYAVNTDYDWSESTEWLRENVQPTLHWPNTEPSLFIHSSAGVIRSSIHAFLREDPRPEFWAYYSAYDWVLFCQLFGSMKQLPRGWPKICLDIEQYRISLGSPDLPKQNNNHHNALADAEWARQSLLFLEEKYAQPDYGKWHDMSPRVGPKPLKEPLSESRDDVEGDRFWAERFGGTWK